MRLTQIRCLPFNTSTPPQQKISVVLLGDSMLERMKPPHVPTVTNTPTFDCLGAWPSREMMNKPFYRNEAPERLENVLNLGVGGDRIQNIAYRMVGQEAIPAPPAPPAGVANNAHKALESYASYLVKMRSVKLWVIQVGSNNLRQKPGLSDNDVQDLAKLLHSLLLIPSNEKGQTKSRILLTWIFPRAGPDGEKVELANKKLQTMTERLDQDPDLAKDCIIKEVEGKAYKVARVVYLSPSKNVCEKAKFCERAKFCDDGVHLNLEGYKEWLKRLVPWAMGMLDGMKD